MKNLQPLILLTLCLLCLSPLSIAGKIYKWTDSEGQVHYGERPPSGQAKQIKVPTAPAHSPAPAARPANQQEATQKLLDSFDKERKEKAETEAKAAKEQARREKNCSSAKRRIAGLKIGGRQYEVDEQGNRHYLSEAEIQSRLAEAQQYADKWCK